MKVEIGQRWQRWDGYYEGEFVVSGFKDNKAILKELHGLDNDSITLDMRGCCAIPDAWIFVAPASTISKHPTTPSLCNSLLESGDRCQLQQGTHKPGWGCRVLTAKTPEQIVKEANAELAFRLHADADLKTADQMQLRDAAARDLKERQR